MPKTTKAKKQTKNHKIKTHKMSKASQSYMLAMSLKLSQNLRFYSVTRTMIRLLLQMEMEPKSTVSEGEIEIFELG